MIAQRAAAARSRRTHDCSLSACHGGGARASHISRQPPLRALRMDRRLFDRERATRRLSWHVRHVRLIEGLSPRESDGRSGELLILPSKPERPSRDRLRDASGRASVRCSQPDLGALV